MNHRYHFADFVGLSIPGGRPVRAGTAHVGRGDRPAQPTRAQVAATRSEIATVIARIVVFLCTTRYCLSLPDRYIEVWIWESLPLTLGFGTGAALLLFAMVSNQMKRILERRRILLLIGDTSYSIFLLHFYFQKRTSNAIRSLGWVPSGEKNQLTALLLLAAIMLVSVGCGILIHNRVEKPLLSRCRRWLRVETVMQCGLRPPRPRETVDAHEPIGRDWRGRRRRAR